METEEDRRPSIIQVPTSILPTQLENENHLYKREVINNVGLAIKKNFYEWTQVTSAHGYVHLGRPNYILLKIFWVIIIAASTGYSFYSKKS